MKYVKFTYVDRLTNVPITTKKSTNGVKLPDGITFLFALESKYPTEYPVFYGETGSATVLHPSFEEVSLDEFTIAKNAEWEARLEQIKNIKISKLKSNFVNYCVKPRVDSGLGYYVDGGYGNLKDFETCLELGASQIRDADNIFRTVTPEDLQTIILAIKSNGSWVYQLKWTIEAQINAVEFTTIEEYDSKLEELKMISINIE